MEIGHKFEFVEVNFETKTGKLVFYFLRLRNQFN